MKSSNYRVVPLSSEVADVARQAAKAGALDHIELVADSPAGYPCRHCLRWAQPGERMILFPYQSIPVGRPYAESGPVFVHAEACDHFSGGQFPEDFRHHRVFRAYNASFDMIDAVVLENEEPDAVIRRLFDHPEAAFLQARSLTHGCYTFAITRT